MPIGIAGLTNATGVPIEDEDRSGAHDEPGQYCALRYAYRLLVGFVLVSCLR